MEQLGEKTHALSTLIHGNLARISQLEGEKAGATGELKDAIDSLIKDKVWKIQTAIGIFWRESLSITIPVLPATITTSVPPFISGGFRGVEGWKV